ncbi:protein bicaudal C homolog 1-B-like [Gigantopelta aegis]|uniref:protein bicaudal C homolog 1-B-like n=1 Tax=Gigantopelta aegis TaxID=1735272 RepID=UPI001B887BC6|nr:protein bicaudal C homolog 1-B-like [Gigantopelta aegis]
MAESLYEGPSIMRDSPYIHDSNVDFCDTSSVGSRDEHVDRDPAFVEDRFRIDRKKLEQMLQAPDNEDDEGAEDFFQRIMDETNTQITWPTKLKIGAKSKKDPHIKLVGYPEDVCLAKEKIMTVLDTKSNRVTLKMDVSHTEHSHVIGKGGNNIKRVMQETGCHIHFPDSNRGSNVQEKSNQVSIAGQQTGVETARSQIRDLLPLVFMFEIPMTGLLQPIPDSSSPAVLSLQQLYNVTITFKQRPRMYVTTVIVRGSVNNAKAVKEATAKLMEQMTGNGNLLVSMQLEIAPQHHLFIIGRGGVNIKQIMQRTCASIHFPDPNTATPQRKGTVYITGNIESVFLARQQLIGCLPLVLMFDVKEDIDLDQGRVQQLTEQLDVYISVKPKPKQTSKSVIVKSIERNASNMYLARLLLLGLEREEILVPANNNNNSHMGSINGDTPAMPMCGGLGLTALGFLSHNLLNVSTTNSLMMMNGHRSPSLGSPVGCPSPASPNNWVSTPGCGVYSPLMVMSPTSNTCAIHGPLNVITQCNGIHKEYPQNSAFVRVTALEQGHSSNNSDSTSPPHSPCASPVTVSIGPPSSVDFPGLQTAGTIGDLVTRENPLSSSGHTLDLLGLSKTTGSSLTKSQSLFMENTLTARSLQNGHVESTCDSSVAETDVSDKRAPGIERKNSTTSLFTNPLPYAFDYEQKKLLALKAMQKKPEGESRTPTDMWSGLGFSKSMPESAIRERMSQLGTGSHYMGPPMSTTFENVEPDLSLDIDRDPWKNPSSMNAPINKAPGEYPSPRKKYEFGLSISNHVDSATLAHLRQKDLWSPKTDLAELFSKLGLGKYTDVFQQQEIDLSTFLTLTDRDLRELGISTFGARRKMLLAIADLCKRRTLQTVTPGGGSHPFQDNGASADDQRRDNIASLSGRW